MYLSLTTSLLTLFPILSVSDDASLKDKCFQADEEKTSQSSDLFCFVPAIMEEWVIAKLSISHVYLSCSFSYSFEWHITTYMKHRASDRIQFVFKIVLRQP